MLTTKQIIRYLQDNPHKNIEFLNVKNSNIHVFKGIEGEILQGEIGDGAIYKFIPEKFTNDMWIIGFNPHKK